MKNAKRILSILLVLILIVGCSKDGGIKDIDKNSEETTIKIGVVGSESRVWKNVAEKVKDKGINLEIVFFDSYNIPNRALQDKEIDLNAFQHYAYLNKEKEELGYDITAIADTIIAPLAIYSNKITSFSELENGAEVVIPDDVTNGGRALVLLQDAGLIKLKENSEELPTIKDIVENSKDLKIIELGANNIPSSLDQASIAVINSGIAVDAGFTPSKDSLFIEKYELKDGKVSSYTNVLAARTEEKDREEFKIILEAYHTKESLQIIEEETKGGSIPVWSVE